MSRNGIRCRKWEVLRESEWMIDKAQLIETLCDEQRESYYAILELAETEIDKRILSVAWLKYHTGKLVMI